MSNDTNRQQTWRSLLPGSALARIIPFAALALFGTLFARHIAALDGYMMWQTIGALSVWQWIGALICTALSFRAIGTYDVLVHGLLQTGQPAHSARRAGIRAIAVSQTLGFGALTSALVRWRCLPDLGVGGVLRLSAVVTLSFLAALAALSAIVVPVSGLALSPLAMIGGALALTALAALAGLAHRLGWLKAPLRLRTIAALMLATALDTGFAALALWCLWPDPIAFHLIFGAYLLALGAGLLSNAPGGVGAFDLSLLALLPVADSAAATGALLAFRLIYYLLPAAIAAISLLKPPKSALPPQEIVHPEAALARQTAEIRPHPKAPLLVLPAWGHDVVLGDLPRDLSMTDLQTAQSPRSLYKCSARQAAEARRTGWAVLRCADEAILNPKDWTTDGPKRRQLRRALKQFAASSLEVRPVRDTRRLAPVARLWATAHGGERGHSMGRFCPDYLSHQAVFAAYDGTAPVAFVSFHTGPVWTLDLMRHRPDLPNGTMQALLVAGIEAARIAGVTRLSLAAVPAPAPQAPFAAPIHNRAAGLRRFKSAFDPIWHPRYICAPCHARLTRTVVALSWTIHRPPALPLQPKALQPNDEDFSFASHAPSCEANPFH